MPAGPLAARGLLRDFSPAAPVRVRWFFVLIRVFCSCDVQDGYCRSGPLALRTFFRFPEWADARARLAALYFCFLTG